jgi:hypothetical protein
VVFRLGNTDHEEKKGHSERRKPVINELYTENCTFVEAHEQIIGRNALNAKVEHILKEAPGFVFRLAGPAEVNHDHGRLRWHFGTGANLRPVLNHFIS